MIEFFTFNFAPFTRFFLLIGLDFILCKDLLKFDFDSLTIEVDNDLAEGTKRGLNEFDTIDVDDRSDEHEDDT